MSSEKKSVTKKVHFNLDPDANFPQKRRLRSLMKIKPRRILKTPTPSFPSDMNFKPAPDNFLRVDYPKTQNIDRYSKDFCIISRVDEDEVPRSEFCTCLEADNNQCAVCSKRGTEKSDEKNSDNIYQFYRVDYKKC